MTTLPNDQPQDPALESIDINAMTDSAALPQPLPPPIHDARYKSCATDFIVHECMDVALTGEGEHLWLHIQKVGMNTAYVAKLLSEWAGITLRDVGYSGLKDRHALTTQWFSLRIPTRQLPEGDFAPSDLGAEERIEILDQQWHNKKLNRGAHRANQFTITLRALNAEADTPIETVRQAVDAHLAVIAQQGVPNYFGPQRFGHGGNNITEALALFARAAQQPVTPPRKNKRKRAPREQHAMQLSAARSLIFNHILAARVRDGSWNTGLAGEVFNLAGSGSIFASEQMDKALRARLQAGDIHPTGVMWGVHNDKVSADAAQLERMAVIGNPLLTRLADGLLQQDIKAQRRALRLPIESLSWQWLDTDNKTPQSLEATGEVLVVDFVLPTGSFATSVLASIVQHLHL